MSKFTAAVLVEADTAEQAQTVLAERLGFEEDYGFDYTVDHTPIVPGNPTDELTGLYARAQHAAAGDSNDEEIEAWREVAEEALRLLGLTLR